MAFCGSIDCQELSELSGYALVHCKCHCCHKPHSIAAPMLLSLLHLVPTFHPTMPGFAQLTLLH